MSNKPSQDTTKEVAATTIQEAMPPAFPQPDQPLLRAEEREAMLMDPGERVNFRSHQSLELNLQYGYLELELLYMGQSACWLVQKRGHLYHSAIRYAGQHQTMKPAEYRTIKDVAAHLDLHAFCWWPNQ